jgi:hypothetical protein
VERGSAETNARTLLSYEDAADAYVRAHQACPPVKLLGFLNAFAALVSATGSVLEIGSATGHDADLLEARGLRVHRTDATHAFVSRLRDRGISAQVLNVITDDLGGPWDGIYANAVFLHLDARELTAVLNNTAAAVGRGGVLGFTLKEGDGAAWTTEKLGRPRYFSYWREPGLRALLEASPWELIDLRRVAAVKDDWLQCLCRQQISE